MSPIHLHAGGAKACRGKRDKVFVVDGYCVPMPEGVDCYFPSGGPVNRLMRFFVFAHLPQALQEPSRSCAELAEKMDVMLVESAEKTAGMRKLLEAKDCFVRARLEQEQTAQEKS